MIASMFAAGKYAAQTGVKLPEIMFWRQAICLLLLLGYLLATRRLGSLRTARMGSHAVRAGMGSTGLFLNFAAAILLPLAEATTLNFTAPLFAVVIAVLVLRDHVGIWRWLAVASGFAGVLVIVQPGHLTLPLIGSAAGLGSALFNAMSSFQIRDLTRTEQPVTVVFYFALFGTLLLSCGLPFFITAHSLQQWALLIAIGICGTIGQLFMTAALRLGTVASVIVMDYSMIIWATLYGATFWHQMPGRSTWLGTPLVVAAGLVIAWREHRNSRPRAVTASVG